MNKVKQFFRDMFLFPDPLTLAVLRPPRPKPTIRLWDKDFKLLAEVSEVPQHVVIDHLGHRQSFRLEFVNDTQYLERIIVWSNPFVEDV